MKEHVTIARATHEDSLDIWRWRNDARTRAMSVSTAELDLPSHTAWFEDSIENSNRYLYVGTWRGEKIGVCRFDLDPDRHVANVSINLNPQMRGQSLSWPLLSAAIAAFRRASHGRFDGGYKAGKRGEHPVLRPLRIRLSNTRMRGFTTID